MLSVEKVNKHIQSLPLALGSADHGGYALGPEESMSRHSRSERNPEGIPASGAQGSQPCRQHSIAGRVRCGVWNAISRARFSCGDWTNSLAIILEGSSPTILMETEVNITGWCETAGAARYHLPIRASYELN